MYNYTIGLSNLTVARLERFQALPNVDIYIEAIETQFWRELQTSQKLKDELTAIKKEKQFREWQRLEKEKTEQAKIKYREMRACISAKSQRAKKTSEKDKGFFSVEIWQNLVQVKQNLTHIEGTRPPVRLNEPIQRFTKRSRQRMMSKARKLNRNSLKLSTEKGRVKTEKTLPIPYFVTLTYHDNFRDCESAKKHLNAFFQRWRRRGKDFAYFWKMEAQERGAIHFHLAMFMPENFNPSDLLKGSEFQNFKKKYYSNPENTKVKDETLVYMLLIGREWAEITKDVDGVNVPLTAFNYIRKSQKIENYEGDKIKTVCADPRLSEIRIHTKTHEIAGTNVRECENWKMFLGYMYKYMEKEVHENDFEGNTGRFWGFSYNLDFEKIQAGIVNNDELNQVNQFCNALNTLAFSTLTRHLIANAKRAKEKYKGQKLEYKLMRYRRTYEAQKRRYEINKDKIELGYSMQFEINANHAIELQQYLNIKTVQEHFEPKQEPNDAQK